MSVIETTEDGWDCVPQLKMAVNKIESIDSFIYEIDKCKRSSELDYMVYEMIDHLKEAITILKEIDTDLEYETI